MGFLQHPTATVSPYKSFGVFGYSTTAADQSFAAMANLMCVVTAGTGSNGYCLTSGTANAKEAIVVVSVWANNASAVAFATGTA